MYDHLVIGAGVVLTSGSLVQLKDLSGLLGLGQFFFFIAEPGTLLKLEPPIIQK